MDEHNLELLQRLVDRLERLSADSTYAHRASGLRGTLLNYMENIEAGSDVDGTELERLIEYGFEILGLAAKEIGAQDE